MIGISMALLAAAVLPAGCGSGGGFLVRPVPAEQRLAESVVSRDRGLLVVDKIAVVDLDGLLENRRHGAFLGDGENPVSLFVEKLDKAQADRAVRAVIVRINSPGGGVTASDIMYQRLMQFRNQSKVPVVAVIEDLGASGGYYVACAADTIFAHRSSVVGSIGAIVQTVSFAGTMSKLGIDAQAVTSGRFKDMASPLKPLDSEDLKILQGMVDEFQKRFAEVVAAGRPKLSVEKVGVLADGRVYTGEQALGNGLVDRVGTMNDAIAYAKQLCGGKRMKVVVYHRPLGYRGTVYA
ncbi:MAG: signal peptide peptidase SppA, partial [Planctomycetes bacterium]|nr:signal peptide peptidase SppA [Planctomycetota bacterium]